MRNSATHPTRHLRLWLLSVLTLVILMVALGGITRLTGSGLSITEWKPIMGAIPPLSDAEWDIAFQKYQQIPQYRIINADMTLSEFKWIFFWEYSHRLLGRLIGLVFALPLLYFWWRKKIPPGYKSRFVSLFLLGGLQGAMGWFMVMSGLSELTSVSHLRLTLHLMLAFIIGGYAWWLIQSLGPKWMDVPATVRRASRFLFGLVFFQCVYGALTAGLKAGFQFPTFPTFNGEWIPTSLFNDAPWIVNFLNNPVTVQWVHRVLGTIIVGFAISFAWQARRTSGPHAWAAKMPAILAVFQYSFGALLVLSGIPLWLGVTHQVLGCIVFLASVHALYAFKNVARDQ